jgi:hypothetical protein
MGSASIKGRTARFGGRNASEISGAYPSSRWRLAQKAASINASTVATSGRHEPTEGCAWAAAACRAK